MSYQANDISRNFEKTWPMIFEVYGQIYTCYASTTVRTAPHFFAHEQRTNALCQNSRPFFTKFLGTIPVFNFQLHEILFKTTTLKENLLELPKMTF